MACKTCFEEKSMDISCYYRTACYKYLQSEDANLEHEMIIKIMNEKCPECPKESIAECEHVWETKNMRLSLPLDNSLICATCGYEP